MMKTFDSLNTALRSPLVVAALLCLAGAAACHVFGPWALPEALLLLCSLVLGLILIVRPDLGHKHREGSR